MVFPLDVPAGYIHQYCSSCGVSAESRAPVTGDAMHTGKMYGQFARAVDLLNVKNQGKGEKVGTMFYTDEMKKRMHYMRHAF